MSNVIVVPSTDGAVVIAHGPMIGDGGGGSSSPLTTKGDLWTYSTADARLAIGANDTVLVADSSAATGNKWSATLSNLTLVAPALGTPASGVATNLTGTASGLTAGAATLAAAATVLATPRAINGVDFDGSAAITVAAAAGTLTGATLASNVTASSLLSAAGGSFGTAAFTNVGVYEVPLTFSTGLTRTVNSVTVNTSQNIDTLSNLTTNGLVTTSGGTGALSVTAPGTGVLTALGVNVGSAGAFVVLGGALGTPSSGVGTNLTGTASGLTAGAATVLATARAIYGNNFDGSATLDQVIASTYGGTGNGFAKLSGPTTTEKTFTLPNASATILTDNAAVTVAQGGTGRATSTTAYGLLAAGTTATGAHQTLAAGATTEILVGGGASALPVWTTAQGSGAPVRATSPTLTTPNIGAATGTSITLSSLTSGRVPFVTTAGLLTDAATLTYNTSSFASTNSQNSALSIAASNANTGTAGLARLYAENSAGSFQLVKLSTGFTTAGLKVADMAYLVNTTGSTAFFNDAATDFIWSTNAIERLRILGGGGVTLTGGTQTTDVKALDITQTWNAAGVAFTAIKANVTSTASAAGSLLMDLQVGGSGKFTVYKSGQVVLSAPVGNMYQIGAGDAGIGASSTLGVTNLVLYSGGGSRVASFSSTYGYLLTNTYTFGWSSNVETTAADLLLTRSAAATLQQGAANAASPVAQILQAQGSRSGTDSNVAGANYTLRSGAGTGNATPSTLILQSYVAVASGTGAQTAATGLTITNGAYKDSVYTVATLPAAPAQGMRCTVTDSNAASYTAGIGSTVAGGGSTAVPVWYSGSAWLIG